MVQKNIRTSDWRLLQASLDDLKTLTERHSDAAVRKMAEKLRMVIATHGAVLKETDALKERTDRVRVIQAHFQFDLRVRVTFKHNHLMAALIQAPINLQAYEYKCFST